MNLRSRFIALFLLIALAGESALAGERFTIVSDVDDTLRVSHVDDRFNLFVRFLFSNRAFSGMPELLQAWKDSGNVERFVYLTGAPSMTALRVRGFLRSQEFPEGELITRGFEESTNLGEYKIQRLENLIAESTDRLILVGDDTQLDAHAYATIFMKYPDRIADIYIRQIHAKELPPAIYPFVTSYDLARYEYDFGRFAFEDVKRVADRILTDPRPNRVLPKFQNCPRPPSRRALGSDIEALDELIDQRVKEICANRVSED